MIDVIVGVAIGGAFAVLVVIPYLEGRDLGDARTWAGLGRVPWYFYRLGVKHDDAKRVKAEIRVREWQARKR